MSFKRESMPSINESDNEEDDDLSPEEDFSTSDYSSLSRPKNATLTKAVNELMNKEEELVSMETEATQRGVNGNELSEKCSRVSIGGDQPRGESQDRLKDASYRVERVPDDRDGCVDRSEIVDHDRDDRGNNADRGAIENGDEILAVVGGTETTETDRFGFLGGHQYTDPDSSDHQNNLDTNADTVTLQNGDAIIATVPVTERAEPDRFGFLRGNQYTDPDRDIIPIQIIRSRERKWQEMLKKWEDYKNKKRKKLESRCRKGIPQSMRCKAWQFLCNSKSLETNIQERSYYKDQLKVPKRRESSRINFRNSTQAVNSIDYDTISVSSTYSTVSPSMKSEYITNPLKSQYHEVFEDYKKITPNQDIVDQIRKDIYRQFPNHENFIQKGGLGQESLSTILTAYSIRHPETGYCQGMAPLAAALLMVMPEEDAFWTFDKICDVYIPGYYDEGLKQIQIDANALNALLKKESSSVFNYLNSYQIEPICYMIDWFMCIYIRTLPWPSVLQVMDMFLCEGKSILFKVALVLIIGAINAHRLTVKEGQDVDVLSVLRSLPEDITTVKYITTHIAKLTVTKTDIRRECENQETLMAKAKAKAKGKLFSKRS